MNIDAIRKAKANMVLDHPFFAALALKLNYVETTDTKRSAIDGVNYFYNQENFEKLSEQERVANMAQCAMKCALGHPMRRDNRDQEKWNLATDHVVNLLLSKCKDIQLPPGSPCDSQYENMTAEVVYNKLPPEGDGGDGGGSEAGVNDSPTGNEQPQDGGKSTNQSKQELEDDWKISTAQAAKAAKMQGNMPSGLADLLTELLVSQKDWKEQLRDFLTLHDKSDYSWARANRRFIANDIYLPAAYNEAMGTIVIALDDSASVSNKEMSQFESELNAILEDCNPTKITVMMCDTQVHKTDEYTPQDLPLKLTNRHYGGTNFYPVFDKVEELDLHPECLVYLTDLYSDTNFPPPDYPVLWVGTNRNGPVPKFGQLTFLEISD